MSIVPCVAPFIVRQDGIKYKKNTVEVLKQHTQNVDKFKEVYSEDRFKARIYAFENDPCAEIDARNAYRQVEDMQAKQYRSEHYLYERMNYLEQRIEALEKMLSSEQNVQECDAREADQGGDAGTQKT